MLNHTHLLIELQEISDSSEVYTVKRLKQRLQEHYQEFIFFAEVEGHGNAVCFKNIAKYIINEKWYSEKKANIEDKAERIVITAAKIIRAEIRERKYNHIQQMMTFPMFRKVGNGYHTTYRR